MNTSVKTGFFNAFRRKKNQVADPLLVSEFEARQRDLEVQFEQLHIRISEVEAQEQSIHDHLVEINRLQTRVNDSLQELATEKCFFERQFLVQRKQIRLAESNIQKHEVNLLGQAQELEEQEDELQNQFLRFAEQKSDLEVEKSSCERLRKELESQNQDLELVRQGLIREADAIEVQNRQIAGEFSKISHFHFEISAEKEQLRQQSEEQALKKTELLAWEETLNEFADEIAKQEHESHQQREIFNVEKVEMQSQLDFIQQEKNKLVQREASVDEKLLDISQRTQQTGLDIEHYEQLVQLHSAHETQLKAQRESVHAASLDLEAAHATLEQERNEFADQISNHENQYHRQQEISDLEKMDAQTRLEFVEKRKSELDQREANIEEKLASLTQREQQVSLDLNHYEQLVELNAAHETQLASQREANQSTAQTIRTAQSALDRGRNDFQQLQEARFKQSAVNAESHVVDSGNEIVLSPLGDVQPVSEGAENTQPFQGEFESRENVETILDTEHSKTTDSPAESSTEQQTDRELQPGNPEWMPVDSDNPAFNSDDEVQQYAEELLARYRPEPADVPNDNEEQAEPAVSSPEPDSLPVESISEVVQNTSPVESESDAACNPKQEPVHREKRSAPAKLDALRKVAIVSARADIANANLKLDRRRFWGFTAVSSFGCVAALSVLFGGDFLSTGSRPIVLTIGCISAIYTLKSLSTLLTMRKSIAK